MVQADIFVLERMVHCLLPITEGFIKGYCFYRFVEPFSKKKSAACGALAYFLTMLLFYTVQISMDFYVIYGMASLAMFLIICQMDRRNYKQKLFLMVTFFSLSGFARSMADILYDFLYDFALNSEFIQNHPDMSSFLYIMMCICYLVLEFIFTFIGIWQVVRVYANKREEMGKKELIMLALPSFMGMIGYEIMRYYRVFYALETGKMEKTYDSLTLLFCAVSSVTIIVVIILYQGIKAKQEEKKQAKLLAAQMDSIRRHIEQVEELYQNIRSVKHDMTNHILTLERLYECNRTKEAETYSRSLMTELAQMTGQIESQNPVTNVILQEFANEAENRGILFHSEFHYPLGTKIDAFDISVILNNALQNAIENTREGKESQISILSYRRNNAYIIEICNSFTGNLQWNAESGLPITSKEDLEGHGYGLPNIRSVAGKYAGDIDITLKNGQFCLCIMLMIE